MNFSPKKYFVCFKNRAGGWSVSHRCGIEDVAFWKREGYLVVLNEGDK